MGSREDQEVDVEVKGVVVLVYVVFAEYECLVEVGQDPLCRV